MSPTQTDKTCVRCGIPFEMMSVSCPDKTGPVGAGTVCLVNHTDWRCPQCGGSVYDARG